MDNVYHFEHQNYIKFQNAMKNTVYFNSCIDENNNKYQSDDYS